MTHDFLKPNIRKSLPNKGGGRGGSEKKKIIFLKYDRGGGGGLKIRDFVWRNIEMAPYINSFNIYDLTNI